MPLIRSLPLASLAVPVLAASAVLIGSGLAAPLCAQRAELHAADIRRVESSLAPNVPVVGMPLWRLEDRMRVHGVPGVSIALIRNYRLIWAKGYGIADSAAKRRVTPSTVFSAGSISKFATAIVALRLAAERKVSLDAPVNDVLTHWKLPDSERTASQPVSLALLLSHRGGTSQSSYFGFAPRTSSDRTPYPSVVDVLRGAPGTESRPVVVNQPVGDGFAYSGGGYMVAQLVLTDAVGLPPEAYAALTADKVFTPLGMRSSTFVQPLPHAFATRAAWAYSTAPWFLGMPYVYPQQAAAGLYSTPTDLAQLLIEVQQAYRGQGRILDSSLVHRMLTPQADVSRGVYREQIGLGAFLFQRSDRSGDSTRYFEHTGVNAGFLAYAMGSVIGGNGVVIMMNNDGGAAELGREIRRAVARVYRWPGFLLDPLKPMRGASRLLADIEGRYQRGPDEVLQLRRGRGAFAGYLEEVIAEGINVGTPILAVPIGRDSLGFTDFPGSAVAQRDSAGRVTGLRIPYVDRAIPKLPPDRQLPGELLRAGRWAAAEAAYTTLMLDESRMTYMAYTLLRRRPLRERDLQSARVLLAVADAQHPASSIVPMRWAEYHLARSDTASAVAAYRIAMARDSTDASIRDALRRLGAH